MLNNTILTRKYQQLGIVKQNNRAYFCGRIV